jgi:hypothetical protein
MRLRRRSHDDLAPRIVWIMASPRSGTTWLLNLLARRPEVAKIDEPGIGTHLGVFLHQVTGAPSWTLPRGQSLVSQVRAASPDYFFDEAHADVWRPALRELILARFAAQAGDARLLVVKEPNGAQAAGMLLDIVPESRLLWMLRDGRDIVDSELDAVASGAWGQFGRWEMDAEDRLRFLEDRAHIWVARAEILETVHAALPDAQRLKVRYEDVLADPPARLAEVVHWLGVDADEAELRRDAEALSVERVPEEHRGKGKFVRSARPGAWRENLTPAEHELLERVMGERLRALGYA